MQFPYETIWEIDSNELLWNHLPYLFSKYLQQSDHDSDCETSFARDKSSQRPKRQSDVTAEILAEVLSPNPSRAVSR